MQDRPVAVDDLPHRFWCASGSMAIGLALRALGGRPGGVVWLPSYHCPTMVQPVVAAGMTPCFYALDERGQPRLPSMADRVRPADLWLVAHYFGPARSLRLEREFADRHGLRLIEDCAHAFFGMAGERPVGEWGDAAVASLPKFFPVAEGGLLASRTPLPPLALAPMSAGRQLRAAVDVLEWAARSGRLSGMGQPMRMALALKRWWRRESARPTNAHMPAPTPNASPSSAPPVAPAAVSRACSWVSRRLVAGLPRQPAVRRRQAVSDLYEQRLSGLPGLRPLRVGTHSSGSAPYVWPVWVDDADRVFAGLRERGWPVLRWDWLWPGADSGADDHGLRWSRHVIQLPCHQSLRDEEAQALCADLEALACP